MQQLARSVRRLRCDRKGNVAVTLGVALVPLALGAGVALDVGRFYTARAQLQWAVDAAALAVGNAGLEGNPARDMAQAFVAANVRGIRDFTLTPLTAPTVNTDSVTLNATGQLPTTFMGLAGIQTMTVAASADVRRARNALLVSLVLDNTGSMWSNNNIGALRDAAEDLVEILFSAPEAEDNLRVSVVPYAASVNVGSAAASIVEPHGFGVPTQSNAAGWKGCVLERTAHALTDTPPGAVGSGTRWEAFHWAPSVDNAWVVGNAGSIDPGPRNSNGLRGPNLGCPTPILPLTGDEDDIEDAIEDMSAWNRGGTLTEIGLAWGLRTLSPGEPFAQSSEIDPATGTSLWNSDRWQRAIVLMTDGDSLFFDLGSNASPNVPHPGASDFTGYGRLGEARANAIIGNVNNTCARDALITRLTPTGANCGFIPPATHLCNVVKQQNIRLIVVVFTSGVSQTVRDRYQQCASPGDYHFAPTQADLSRIFNQIGRELTRLRVNS
jgi:Flp pilus assembly protein TadG